MRWRYRQGWLLFEVSLATLLLMIVVLGSCLWLQRQSVTLQQARLTLLADRLLMNGLELRRLDGEVNTTRWEAWRARSEMHLPGVTPRYHCGLEVCTLCFYRKSITVPWRCLSAARPASVSLN